MSIFNFFKTAGATPTEAELPDAPMQDTKLPYGAKFGSLLSLPLASYVSLSNSLIKLPDQAQLTVDSISRLEVEGLTNAKIYRFYTNKGSALEDKDQSFLQLLLVNDEVAQATYYKQLLRLIPATAEEQEPYLGRGYGLGDIYYHLGRDLLLDSYLSPALFEKVLKGKETLEYFRDAPTDVEYIAPYRATEFRLDDARGYTGMDQEIRFMPYWREVDGGKEMLTINFEKVRTINGIPQQALHVDFHLGLQLDHSLITIL